MRYITLITKNNNFLLIPSSFLVYFASFKCSGISIVASSISSKKMFFTGRFQYLITSFIPVLQLWHGVITYFAPVAFIWSAFTLLNFALCDDQFDNEANPPPALQQKLCSRFGVISLKSSHVCIHKISERLRLATPADNIARVLHRHRLLDLPRYLDPPRLQHFNPKLSRLHHFKRQILPSQHRRRHRPCGESSGALTQ